MQNPHEAKMRIIQEIVPGRQVTLAHIIANPNKAVYKKIALSAEPVGENFAIGIISVTPPEISLIAADLAAKEANVQIQSVDYTAGTLFLTGRDSAIEASLDRILNYLKSKMDFEVCKLTRT